MPKSLKTSRTLIAAGLLGLLAACETVPANQPDPLSSTNGRQINQGGAPATISQARLALPTTAEADAFAIAHFAAIQGDTVAARREFCGYFRVNGSGTPQVADQVVGTLSTCPRNRPPSNTYAAWHTHGAYDINYDTEVPSPQDMIGTFQSGIDGYLGTPGGRVWRIEAQSRTAVLLCTGCIPVDPGYKPSEVLPVRPTYNGRTLLERYSTFLGIGRTIITN